MVTTKVILGILFSNNLFRVFYGITFFAVKLPFDVTEVKTFVEIIIVSVFVVTTLSYLFFAYERKNKLANLIFKIQTILAIVTFLLFLFIYLGENDGTKFLGLGFFVDIVLIAGMVIFSWFSHLFEKVFKILFKKELIAINQYEAEPVVEAEPEKPEVVEAEPEKPEEKPEEE